MSAYPVAELSPLPLLDAFERFAGQYVDLDRNRVLNAGEMREMRDRIARQLSASGSVQDRRIVFCLGNGPLFTATLLAVLSQHAAPLLLHCDTPPTESLRYAREFGATKIVTDSVGIEELAEICTTVRTVDAGNGYALAFGDVDAKNKDFVGGFPAIGAVPLHPTSGTTGRPKVAVRHATAAVAEGLHYAEAMEIDSSDKLLCVVPMSHAYGYGTCMMMPLLRDVTVYTLRKFNPRHTARTIAENPITTFFATPAIIDLLLAARKSGDPIPRRVLSAGAPLSERTGNRFHEATGQYIHPLYGTTETGGVSVACGSSAPCMESNVGPPMPAIEIDIRRVDDANELESGLGRVAIKTPSAMAGYLQPTGIDRSSIVDGWITTGDIGRIDTGGNLHLVGRESEFINVFGMKVVPSEVEAVVARFPGVTDVKVYAGRHRSGSDIVKACIAAPEGFDVAALSRFCQENLVHYKRPEAIVRLDAVPRSPLGKIIKDQLP